MERTPGRSASMRQWLISGVVAILLLVAASAVGTARAQEVDEGELVGLASLSYPGYICFETWCYNPETHDVILWDELYENSPDGPDD
jgi:hypothetical protein